MQTKFLLLTLIPLIAACSNGSAPPVQSTKNEYLGNEILVIDKITISDKTIIRKAIREECQLEEKLIKFIDQYAAGQYAQILSNTDLTTVPNNTQILTIEIDQVMGSQGGGWTGTKGVMISGNLRKNQELLGSFKGRRLSGGGFFGTYKGTCAILGRCVKALGKDIAAWLKSPHADAIIGDY